jgi:uracil-DNA glycosylase family 4
MRNGGADAELAQVAPRVDPRRLKYLEAMGVPLWVPRARPRPAGSAALAAEACAVAPAAASPAPDWEALAEQVAACTACELHRTRTQTVFGVGDRSARWMLIGEAPGADEDRQGEPFVGRAGQLLNAMLRAIGLRRDEVYIANILKCRPPRNRDPSPEEVACCEGYLHRQVALLQPRVILALGRVAAHNLLKTDVPLGRMRGRCYAYKGIPLVVTYHPAYLLRSPAEKRKAWDDLCYARRVVAADHERRPASP